MLDPRRLATLEDDVRECSRAFDASYLAPHEAVDAVGRLARVKAMVSSMESRAAARVAESRAWAAEGDLSAAVWLAKQTGTTTSEAKAQLETAAKLRELPQLDEAMRRGELSPAQAAVVADAAAVNPAAESQLLELAQRESLQGLREEGRRLKAAADPDPDATYRRIHAERRVRGFTDGEGARNLTVRGPADLVAKIEGRLEAKADQLFKRAHAEGRREPRDAYLFDALVALVTEPGAAPTATSRRRANQPAYLALLRVDLAALVRGQVDGDELCELPGIGPVPATRARELLGESILKLVITDGVDVRNVTHLGRGPTTAQLVALLWEQHATCVVAGCDRARVEFDHGEPWATRQQTVVGDLWGRCHHHHDLKTLHGWDDAVDTDPPVMVPPDDPRHPKNQRRPREGDDEAA